MVGSIDMLCYYLLGRQGEYREQWINAVTIREGAEACPSGWILLSEVFKAVWPEGLFC